MRSRVGGVWARLSLLLAALAVLAGGCGSSSTGTDKQARITTALRDIEHELLTGKEKAPSGFRGQHVLGMIVLVYARPPYGVSGSEWKAAIAHDKRLQRIGEETEVLPVGGTPGPMIATPARITKAGEHELAEYERGEKAVAESGCLACHKIGDNGNAGPGPDLTHVAGRLPKPAIARTLVNPTAPMPSFKHLPPEKFQAIVAFLAALK
jgi:mono/diheme cytochrome c family protein